jgi:hypothetical protein
MHYPVQYNTGIQRIIGNSNGNGRGVVAGKNDVNDHLYPGY